MNDYNIIYMIILILFFLVILLPQFYEYISCTTKNNSRAQYSQLRNNKNNEGDTQIGNNKNNRDEIQGRKNDEIQLGNNGENNKPNPIPRPNDILYNNTDLKNINLNPIYYEMNRLPGYNNTWPSGCNNTLPSDYWPPGYWSSGYWPPGHNGAWPSRYNSAWPSGYNSAWSPGYLPPRHNGQWSPGHNNSRPSGGRNNKNDNRVILEKNNLNFNIEYKYPRIEKYTGQTGSFNS